MAELWLEFNPSAYLTDTQLSRLKRIPNLALACDRCNAYKGSNLTGIDPDTGALIPLFSPRVHAWDDHFVLSDVTIVGLTAMGRTTVRVLNMNDARRIQLRAMLKRHEQL